MQIHINCLPASVELARFIAHCRKLVPAEIDAWALLRCKHFSSIICDNLLVSQVGVHMPADPVLAAWKGASAYGMTSDYHQHAISKAHYEEVGCDRLLNLTPGAAKTAVTEYYTSSG